MMSPVHPSPASNMDSPGVGGGASMDVDGSSDEDNYVRGLFRRDTKA